MIKFTEMTLQMRGTGSQKKRTATMTFFEQWCEKADVGSEHRRCWKLTERPNARDTILPHLCQTIRSHYDDLSRISADIEELGFTGAAAILHERLPRTRSARSGELGEILATEIAEDQLGFRVPVRRLRYKDGRDMALRGDDFIGVAFDDEAGLRLMKGEAKSRRILGATTIRQAREALNRNDGRPTPCSLLFVADRLLEGEEEDEDLGRTLRNEVARRAVPANRIDHMLFTFSGNIPPSEFVSDIAEADETHPQTAINIMLDDHPEFIETVYERAGFLGDS